MPYRPGDPVYYFEAKIEVTTAKAHLLMPTMGEQKEVWCPKSQIVSISEPDENGNRMFEVTQWWFEKSGLDKDA